MLTLLSQLSEDRPLLAAADDAQWLDRGSLDTLGRPLADNAPEVMLSLVAGTAVPSGLKPSVARHLRDGSFPYVVPA